MSPVQWLSRRVETLSLIQSGMALPMGQNKHYDHYVLGNRCDETVVASI